MTEDDEKLVVQAAKIIHTVCGSSELELPLWSFWLLCLPAPNEALGVMAFSQRKLNFIDLHRNYKSVEDKKQETPFERFKRFTEQVMSVPRAEIKKRELQWKNDRKKHETHKRHR